MDVEEYRNAPVPRIVRAGDFARRGIVVRGGPTDGWRDVYHHLLTLNWLRFMALVACVYLGVNLVFASLYWLDPNALANARPRSFVDAFNFSVETLGTIGYGAMSPKSAYANLLVTAEAFTSIALTAVLTGLIFARVSRPTARVRFTEQAVITGFDGKRTLMFRAANQRSNQILEATANVTLARQVVTQEGAAIRRFEAMKMVREMSPLFALTWTVMHVIDEASPLFGLDADGLRDIQAEIVVVLSGLDETFAQRVHARHSYTADEIVWDRNFEDVIYPMNDGTPRWVIDYTRFDTFKPGSEPPAQESP